MSVFPPDLDWVNNAGKMEFSERVQCIIQQFENMSMEGVDLKVDGEETVEENTADTVGVRLAYRAYIRRTQLYGEEPGLQLSSSTGPTKALSARQLFWVSFASSFCAKNKSSEELLTDYNKDPVHAPAAFRVVGTVMNQHEFAADFGCPAGSPMNPVHKCRVW
ncbi:hypothetical protein ONE63_001047 [Megalurothrips usitatus]|nr:hypothetical protein ONE63_001047 [Megalurothrips usitatus]